MAPFPGGLQWYVSVLDSKTLVEVKTDACYEAARPTLVMIGSITTSLPSPEPQ